MKKLLIVLCLFISGCVYTQKYHLDFFYVITCPNCMLFKEDVIPYLEKTYANLVITTHNIDKEESLDLYAKTISLLQNYVVNDDTGSVPFIVLDGCFVKFGYNYDEKDLFLNNLDKAINGKTIELSQDYYLFKEGKKLY